MRSLKNSLLLTVLFAMVGCASPPAVVYTPPQVPPLPPEIGTKREASLTDRLTKLLMPQEDQAKQSEQPSKPSQPSSPKATATRSN